MPQIIPFIFYALGAANVITATETAIWVLVSSLAVSWYEAKQASGARGPDPQDRRMTVRSGIAPRQYIFGTMRTGGAMQFIGTIGSKREALDSVIALCNNQATLRNYILGDDFIGTAAFPGTKYGRLTSIKVQDTFTGVIAASGTVQPSQPVDPILPGAQWLPRASWKSGTKSGICSVVVNGASSVTVSGMSPGSNTVYLTYYVKQAANLRGQFKSGTNAQTATAWTDFPNPEWDSGNHRLQGVAHLRMLMIWDQNVYQNGAPAVGAVVTGRCVDGIPFYDPRNGGSNPVDCTNPALIAGYWMTLPRYLGGCGIPAAWIDWQSVADAAAICDEICAFKGLDGTGTQNLHRYECHTLLSTETPPLDNLDIILTSMAGRRAFTGGKYKIFAGAFRPALFTVTDDDIVGSQPFVVSTANVDGDSKNMVTCTFLDDNQHWLSTSPQPIKNQAYITSDGYEAALDLQLQATTDIRHACYIMGVELERQRPCLAISCSVIGLGENLCLYDTVQFAMRDWPALADNGAGAYRTFELTKIVDNWDGTFQIECIETKSTTYTLDPSTYTPLNPVTPPDNSYLWDPPVVNNLAVASFTPSKLPDGTAVWAMEVTWDAITSAGTVGSSIQLRYMVAGGKWIDAGSVPGDGSTGTTITAALIDGEVYTLEARFVNGIGATSHWADYMFQVAGADIPSTGWVVQGPGDFSDGSFKKHLNAAYGWNCAVYTPWGFSAAAVQAKFTDDAWVGMVGLTEKPGQSADYSNLAWALYHYGLGGYQVYKDGQGQSAPLLNGVVPTTKDVIVVSCDSVGTIRILINDVERFTVVGGGVGHEYHGQACLYGKNQGLGLPYLPGGEMQSLKFSSTGWMDTWDTSQISGGAITNTKLGPSSVKGGNIYPGEVNSGHIGTGQVKNPNIDTNAVQTVNVLADNITTVGKAYMVSGSDLAGYAPETVVIHVDVTCSVDTSKVIIWYNISWSVPPTLGAYGGVSMDLFVDSERKDREAIVPLLGAAGVYYTAYGRLSGCISPDLTAGAHTVRIYAGCTAGYSAPFSYTNATIIVGELKR